MSTFVFPIVIGRDDEGCFADCPSLQGCYAQGDTYEEALEHIRDAIRLHIEDRRATGEAIPVPGHISVTTLEISA